VAGRRGSRLAAIAPLTGPPAAVQGSADAPLAELAGALGIDGLLFAMPARLSGDRRTGWR